MATLLGLIEDVGRALGTYRSGTMTAGTTSTFTDLARRVEEDDTLVDATVVVTSGSSTGTANWRRISANVQSTGVSTILSTFAATPTTNTYDIFLPPFHPVYHLIPALNMALQEHFSAKPVFRQAILRCPHGTTRLSMPSNYRDVNTVKIQGGSELLANEDFYSGSGSWTLDSNTLSNSGENGAQVLNIAAASRLTTQDAAVVGDTDYDVSARMLGDGTATARLRLRWLDSASAQIGSDITVGTVASSTAWTRVGAIYRAPANAAFARVVLDINVAGQGYVRYASVAEVRPWLPLSDWDIRNDAGTKYLEFGSTLPWRKDILIEGVGVEATLSADTDSITMEDNDTRYLCARACEKAYGMLVNEGGSASVDALRGAGYWKQRATEIRRENAQRDTVSMMRPTMRGY